MARAGDSAGTTVEAMSAKIRIGLIKPSILACLSGLLASAVLLAGEVPTREMTGDWSGRGEIVVSWTKQRQISVQLTISPDGAVQGTIGDARLSAGKFTRNRGWLGRALNIKTDYIITGPLEGCIVASENVCRDSVKIPLHWSEGHFTGSLHTSGTHVGGKDRMVFTAGRLSLLPIRP